MTDKHVHDPELHRQRASSFGGHAAAYAEHRPDYPEAAARWALEPVADRPRPHVLDVGAGTGKLTEVLVRLGLHVTAVEPDPQMSAELRRRLPEVEVLAGRGEEIPLPDGSVDAVLAGQAFHWFDPELAFPEIARVLRPGGVLAALWNADDGRVAWVRGLGEVARSRISYVGFAAGPSTTEALRGHPWFEAAERAKFEHVQSRTADSLTATIGTHSHTLVISDEERAEVLARVRQYLASRPETATGAFDVPIITLTHRMVLRPRTH